MGLRGGTKCSVSSVRLLSGSGRCRRSTLPFGVNGIDCKSAAFNRPYISAHGQVSACCWVTGSDEEAAFFKSHGLAPERYNIRNRPLEDILLDEPFTRLYAQAWEADSLATCRSWWASIPLEKMEELAVELVATINRRREKRG